MVWAQWATRLEEETAADTAENKRGGAGVVGGAASRDQPSRQFKKCNYTAVTVLPILFSDIVMRESLIQLKRHAIYCLSS